MMPLWACLIIGFTFLNKSAYSEFAIEWTGCDSYAKYSELPTTKATEDCMFSNTDILPDIYMKKLNNLSTAQDCKKTCKSTFRCKYFTFVSGNEAAKQKTKASLPVCYLKAAPGYSTSPIMILRSYDPAKTTFNYVSGPVDGCNQQCKESTPVSFGCHGATPVTCAALKLKFSTQCIFKPMNCLESSYSCCEKTPLTHKDLYYQDRTVLVNGNKTKTIFKGIWSAEECYALCMATSGCTAWNFALSPITQFIGGACFMKFYTDTETNRLVSAPIDLITSKSAHDCMTNNNCATKTTEPWPYPPFEGGTPLPVSCFYPNLSFDSRIKVYYSEITPEKCQDYCKATDGCRFFIKKKSFCQLSYTNKGYASLASQQDSSIVGPSECNHVVSSDECSLNGKAFVGTLLITPYYLHTAGICQTNCIDNPNCVGWTYESTQCSLFQTITGTKNNENAISANSNCDIFKRLRVLEQQSYNPSQSTDPCTFNQLIFADQYAYSRTGLDETQCRNYCKAAVECTAFSHTAREGFDRCVLYKNTTNQKPNVYAPWEITTLKTC